MLLVDNFSVATDGVIIVPIYHRGHLSLRTGTEVTVCLLPPNSNLSIPGMHELVVSPVSFKAWKHLIRITALFKDYPGVVRKLAHAIQMEGIDVVYEESATIHNGSFHRVEFLADAADVYERFRISGYDSKDVLPSLERRLQAICLDELELNNGIPRLKVREMEGLRQAYDITSAHQMRTSFTSYQPWSRQTINKGKLQIPDGIMDILSITSPRVILISDTKDRILRVLIPGAETFFTYVRVNHIDQIGALFRISDALSKTFTAVSTLTRLKKQGHRNDVEFLLYSNAFPHENQENSRKQAIYELLGAHTLRDLKIEISYPKKAGDITQEGESYDPVSTGMSIKKIEKQVQLEQFSVLTSTTQILMSKIERYSNAHDQGIGSRQKAKLLAARRLYMEESTSPPPVLQIFISYSFCHNDLYKAITEIFLKSGNVEIISGNNPDGHGRPFRDEIRNRIKESQGFVTVCTTEDTKWLVWELGVAHAYEIPVAIFVHENQKATHPYHALIPEQHCIAFNDMNFPKKFSEKWNLFQKEAGEFYRKKYRRPFDI